MDNDEVTFEDAAKSALEHSEIPATADNIELVMRTAETASREGLLGAAEEIDDSNEATSGPLLRAVATAAIKSSGFLTRETRRDLLLMRLSGHGSNYSRLREERVRARNAQLEIEARRNMPRS